MTKFELARTAGRWRPRSRTYVALAILFVTAWATNADVFHDAFAVWRPSIDAKGEVSYRRGHLRPLLLHSSSVGRARFPRTARRRRCRTRGRGTRRRLIQSPRRRGNAGGMFNPITFAVLRLITNSYLAGACTGRSPGFSPRRMRST